MATIERHPDWVNPDCDLVGIDGNTFTIMGTVLKALRKVGNDSSVIEAYTDEAKSGDYDHLLQVSMLYSGMFE